MFMLISDVSKKERLELNFQKIPIVICLESLIYDARIAVIHYF